MKDSQAWPAPTAVDALDAAVRVPGSKSLTARYLALAALANTPSVIRGALRSRDTELMIGAIAALGTRVRRDLADDSLVQVAPRDWATAPQGARIDIDCGLAGTVMRFVPPIAAATGRNVRFDGDEAARGRPVAPLLRALREAGFSVTDDEGEDADSLPFTISPATHSAASLEGRFGRFPGRSIVLDSSGSSQFLSALLLAGSRADGPLTIALTPETAVPSEPHIDMTIATLREFGVEVTAGKRAWTVLPPKHLEGRTVTVEPDLSNAAPFLCAALVAGGNVSIPLWPAQTTQPGDLLREYFPAFGGAAGWTADVGHPTTGTLTAAGTGHLRPVNLDLSQAGEIAPTLAALAALAPGRTTLRGIAHLRGHETNRLAALVAEITRLGGIAHELDDGIEVDNPTDAPAGTTPWLHGAHVHTYGDHRMATFAAVIGLRVPGVAVDDITVTSKTMPEFPRLWADMLGQPPRSGARR